MKKQIGVAVVVLAACASAVHAQYYPQPNSPQVYTGPRMVEPLPLVMIPTAPARRVAQYQPAAPPPSVHLPQAPFFPQPVRVFDECGVSPVRQSAFYQPAYQPVAGYIPPESNCQCSCANNLQMAARFPTAQPMSNYYAIGNGPTMLFRPQTPVGPQGAGYYIGRGLLGQPKVFMPNQPLRNMLRYVSP